MELFVDSQSPIDVLRRGLAAVSAERDELQRVFDLRSAADARARARWQAAHPGREDTWPDHADLVVWLLEQDAALRKAAADLLVTLPHCWDAGCDRCATTESGSVNWESCDQHNDDPDNSIDKSSAPATRVLSALLTADNFAAARQRAKGAP